ncbi:MAG: carbohydrate ABC transporter permease [Bacilli bacterium]|nr:carbohydrate ABC transporter permease [Bacilli bacterium]
MKHRQRNSLIFRSVLIVFFIFVTILVFFPLYFVIVTSLKSYAEYIRNPVGIDVTQASLANYAEVLSSTNMLRAFLNSTILTLISVACSVVFSAIGAFAVVVIDYRGSKIFYFLSVMTMFFTGELTYIPLYLAYSYFGLLNSYWVLLIPCFIGFPSLGIMLGCNYLGSTPKEIQEAALVDGAGYWTMFTRIFFPMMRPVIALIAVMSFQSAWSEFFWPMITTLGNPDVQTLPLLILAFNSADSSLFGQYCAGLALMTLPMIVVYIFCSKYFIQGMTAGSVKL